MEVDASLIDLPAINLFLDTSNGDQPVHDDISLLTYAADSINSLVVIGWVPIWVQDHDTISTSEVKSKATDLSG